MKIAIDLDDVLSQTMPALVKFHNEIYKTKLKEKDIKIYDLSEIFNEKTDEGIRRKVHEFHTTHYGQKIKPIKGAKKVLEKLKKNNELYIITARSEDIKKETEEWVEKHFPNIFSKIYFSKYLVLDGKEATKKSMCNDIGIDMFIEDNIKYAMECVEPNRKIYLFDYPWNQTNKLPNEIKRIFSWAEIEKLI